MKYTMNEETLKRIIEQSVYTILNESLKDNMNFGIKGNIPLSPASSLCDDVNPQVLDMVDSGNRGIPYSKLGEPQYFGGTKVWDAYEKYSAAITRGQKPGKTAVSFFVFLKKIRNGWKGGALQVYESNENYLIGTMRNGIFLCIYLCPKNAGIGLFKFIKEICEYDNVVFAVTDDLGDMLERLGCPKYNGTVQAKFRGKVHDKVVYGSTQEAAEQGAKLLGLMAKTSDLGNAMKDAMLQNPKLKAIYDQDPNIAFKLMNEPIITQFLANNPNIVDMFISNPSILQSMANDPIRGFMGFLRKYSSNIATSSINERKNK